MQLPLFVGAQMKIVISSGHFGPGTGAVGPKPWGIDEGSEVRVVTDRVAKFARAAGAEVVVIHDNVSNNKNDNLDYLVNATNEAFDGDADLSVSIHFNDTDPDTESPIGTECWYYSQDELAEAVASEIAMASGLKDRGKKYSDGLAMLVRVDPPAILVEVCFVGSKADCDLYHQHQEAIAQAIAATITGEEIGEPPSEIEPPEEALFYVRGKVSWFGGPDDITGVTPDEGLAFFYSPNECPHLMLPEQPPGTTGMARRLDPGVMYVAARWPYDEGVPKEMLRDQTRKALVRAGDRKVKCYPADFGPHAENTDKAIDLSPAAMEFLELESGDKAELIYPAPE